MSLVVRKMKEVHRLAYDESFDRSLAQRVAIAPLFTKRGVKEKTMMDLSKIKIPSVDDIKSREEEALKRKTYAEEAGKLLSGTLASVGAYKDIEKQGGVLSSNDKAEMERLVELVDKLRRSGDPEIQKHIEFVEFMEEIRSSEPTEEALMAFLEKAVALGRVKAMDKFRGKDIKYPNILFRDKLYVCPEEKTPAQEGLNAELWSLASAVRKEHKNKLEDGACEDMALFKKGESRKYKILFLERTDDSGRKWEKGVGYIRISIRDEKGMPEAVKVVTILGGQGSARWLNQSKDQWFPFYWLEKGIPNHICSIRPDFAKFAEKAIKMLKAGIASYYSRQKVGK